MGVPLAHTSEKLAQRICALFSNYRPLTVHKNCQVCERIQEDHGFAAYNAVYR